MSLRSAIICLLSFVLSCASDLPEAAETHAQPPATLTFEAGSDVSVHPNATHDLVVLYKDASGVAREGMSIDFSLTGTAAAGASLNPWRATTDALGRASTRLRVGSTTADLQVRAIAPDAKPQYIQVAVRDGAVQARSVGVRYAGQRDLASYMVTAVPGKTCAQVGSAAMTGEAYTLSSEDDRIEFKLAAGMPIAIVAWGRDDTGAKLARGCTDVEDTSEAATDARGNIVVVLEDTPLRFEGELPLEIELSVAASTRVLADAAKRAVESLLMPDGSYAMFAEADYYLDAIRDQLTAAGEADAVTRLTALRASTALSASLTPALTTGDVGANAVAEALGMLITKRGAGLVLRTRYGESRLALPSEVIAMSADGGQSLALAERPSATISARLDAARAELSITALGLELGVGQYGLALLTALERENAVDPALEAAGGCRDVVGPWWAKSELAVTADASLAVAGCERAVEALKSTIEGALSALNGERRVVELQGAVPVHDRTEDGLVDDLGPGELEGRWGGESVLAEVRVPAKTAFAQ